MTRERLLSWIKSLAKLLVDLEIEGAENIPPTGGALLTTSHISRLDTPFLMISTSRQDVTGLVAREYQRAFFFGWVLKTLGVIWITRGENDMTALRETLSALASGKIVGIAPEGHRSKTGLLEEGKPGAALIAQRAEVPIIPATVSGSNTMMQSLTRFRKMRVRVVIGKPYMLKKSAGADQKEWLLTATDEIMCRIAALMSPERRGFYANHPRLAEILAAQNGGSPEEKNDTDT